MFHSQSNALPSSLIVILLLLTGSGKAFQNKSFSTTDKTALFQKTMNSSNSNSYKNDGIDQVQMSSSSAGRKIRHLPQSLLIGYTTNKCNDLTSMQKVIDAVENGVNVLIWSFIQFDIVIEENDGTISSKNVVVDVREGVSSHTSNFLTFKKSLVEKGYENVIHLVAFGGWNGPHLPSGISGDTLYNTWKAFNTYHKDNSNYYYFDGFDWDIEGQDDPLGPRNVITIECLNQMKIMSQRGHEDGFIVSMAPAQSYLDITTTEFSRQLNLSPVIKNWHDDFNYHGRNVYAYLLADGHIQSYDFIQIQFYESYSNAGYNIFQQHISSTQYLINYIKQLLKNERSSSLESNNNDTMDRSTTSTSSSSSGYYVNFENDPSIDIKNQYISIPINKLLFGFANGWALNNNSNDKEKTLFISPRDIKQAFESLVSNNIVPRGYMFWVIEEEGTNDIEFAKKLSNLYACGINPSTISSTTTS